MDQKPKAYKIVWSVQASSSMKGIFDTIVGESKQGAARVVNGLYDTAQKLKLFPNGYAIEPLLIGEPVTYRFIAKWNWKIIFVVDQANRTVLIVDIFDTRQDSKKLKV